MPRLLGFSWLSEKKGGTLTWLESAKKMRSEKKKKHKKDTFSKLITGWGDDVHFATQNVNLCPAFELLSVAVVVVVISLAACGWMSHVNSCRSVRFLSGLFRCTGRNQQHVTYNCEGTSPVSKMGSSSIKSERAMCHGDGRTEVGPRCGFEQKWFTKKRNQKMT